MPRYNIRKTVKESNKYYSEISHYKEIARGITNTKLLHLESNSEVVLSNGYVDDLLSSANSFTKEVKIGREDKFWTAAQITKAEQKGEIAVDEVKVGDLRVEGIRSIWEGIHSKTVFTVCYDKQPKSKTKKQFKAECDEQIATFVALIEKTAKQKKGIAAIATKALVELQANPIDAYIREERVLRGYKTQYISRDGKYQCMDMDLNAPRPVNINTIKWLIFGDVKYIVQ